MSDKPKKPVSASRVELCQLMLPEHANAYGNVHGGLIMKMVDETGGIAAMRHAQRPCVTVSIDEMSFVSPVHVGELLCCKASVNYVGTSSVEVGVHVHAENPITGEITHTNSAYLVYVAIDDAGKPCKVPGLLLETDADRRRHEGALERQEERLAHRKRKASDA
ncbi:MAG: acyl-CoA thioesterase [Myxococcales bacterium]|nr:acyl-CoA thioesterase [Myxococcales bacterium]